MQKQKNSICILNKIGLSVKGSSDTKKKEI
jgi:hypothetical protein